MIRLIDITSKHIEEQDHKLLYKMGAVEIADLFDWSIEKYKEDRW